MATQRGSSTGQLDHAALLAKLKPRIHGLVNRGAEICPEFVEFGGDVCCKRCGYQSDVHLVRDCLAALTSPVTGESDSDPIVRCASCGCHDEATVTLREDVIDHLHKGRITVVVPVWTCNACGESWTGHRAEAIRDAVVAATPSPAAAAPAGEQ